MNLIIWEKLNSIIIPMFDLRLLGILPSALRIVEVYLLKKIPKPNSRDNISTLSEIVSMRSRNNVNNYYWKLDLIDVK